MSDTTLINTSIKSVEEIANVENDPNYWRELTPEEANLLCQLATELQSIGMYHSIICASFMIEIV
jgi:hypothetical protein